MTAFKPFFFGILPGEPNWTIDDSAALRAFIVTPAGQAFLRHLAFTRPNVSERRDTNVRRIQSDERAGYEACIADILHLADPNKHS